MERSKTYPIDGPTTESVSLRASAGYGWLSGRRTGRARNLNSQYLNKYDHRGGDLPARSIAGSGKLVLAAVTVLWMVGAHAAGVQEAEIRTALDQMFQGMRNAEPDKVRAVLSPETRFSEVVRRDGVMAIISEDTDWWLKAISESEGKWDYQMYDVQVRVDGYMASVWNLYTFYLDAKITHCGSASIELLKDDEGWKVTQFAETYRLEDCPDPLGVKDAP